MQCERCGAKPPGEYDLHDYCADCSKNLCDPCMAKGCCGNVPATSGQGVDEAESEEHQAEVEKKAGV